MTVKISWLLLCMQILVFSQMYYLILAIIYFIYMENKTQKKTDKVKTRISVYLPFVN